MEILVFRTDIGSKNELEEIAPLMENFPSIQRWNVDFHDIDKILRIETELYCARSVEEVLQNAGYFCQELED